MWNIIKTYPPANEPKDLFEPHFATVDQLSNMDEFFESVRKRINDESQKPKAKNRFFSLVTPGRLTTDIPAPMSDPSLESDMAFFRSILPDAKPQMVTAICYNKLEAIQKDIAKSIPFLMYLCGFAYIGHNVIAFEGHPSAFASGIRNCDCLLIDDGMLNFLPLDWYIICKKNMSTNSIILIYKREYNELWPVVKSTKQPGWQYGELDGEESYANCLLMTIAKLSNQK
jgi:hypothetical protein